MMKKINQHLNWFLESDYCTFNTPVTSLDPNDVTHLDSFISNNPNTYTGFDITSFKKGNKLIIHYSNESQLNYQNLPKETDVAVARETAKLKELIHHLNIPIKDIILVGSIYEQHNAYTRIGLNIGLDPSQIILIDYYELQTFLFHKMYSFEYNKQYNYSAEKDLKYIFGKVHKVNRLIAMYELWSNNMLENAVTGCLVKQEDLHKLSAETVKEYKIMFNEDVSEDDIFLMLKNHHGSPDNVDFKYFKRSNDSAIDISNHHPCYPYDYKMLFTNTKMSLVPETMFYKDHPVFITEKTYVAIHNHHPFVVLSTPNFLSTLHSRGYKTFDQICDESYDYCFNDKKRLKMVIESTKQIINSSKIDIIQSITKHNFNRLENNALNTIRLLNESFKNIFS